MPSSLVSTANSSFSRPTFSTPAATSGAVPASIGRTGRPTSMLNSSSASVPRVRAATAIGPVGALNIAARRTACTGTSAAAAIASSITESRAPWRTLPVIRLRR